MTDIVMSLRDCTCVPHGEICREAADKIERLRSVAEAWLKYAQRAERDIETLRAERDEAKQECDRLARRNAVLVVKIDALREKELERDLYGGEG